MTVTLNDNDVAAMLDTPNRRALVRIFTLARGDGWTRKEGWNGEEPIGTWYGVSVDEVDEMVTELRLEDNNLSGIVADEIGELTELRYLYLNDNSLTGEFPFARLSALKELRELAFWGNKGLEGDIPDPDDGLEIGKRIDRAALRTINEVNGGSAIAGWFPGEEEDPFSYSDWMGITLDDKGRVLELALPGAGLSGEITNAFSALYTLSARDLSGKLERSIADLLLVEISLLKKLDLSGNPGLTGDLPFSFINLTGLKELDISGTSVCPPEDYAFDKWIQGLGDNFKNNDDCGNNEGVGVVPGNTTQGGGGCAIASGDDFMETTFWLIVVIFGLITVFNARGYLNVWRRPAKIFSDKASRLGGQKNV